jgi:hypothetical protein
MAPERTCGRGLAEAAALPAKLGDVEAALAETLEAHLASLDLEDEAARTEHDVYVRLAREHRRIAAELHAVADEMAAQRDLAMGRHDAEALTAPAAVRAFGHVL